MTEKQQQSDLAGIPAVSFDLSNWTQLALRGGDAKTFLHNFCTQDITGLPEKGACEAFVCNIKGRILAHLLVWHLPDHLHIIAVPGTAEDLVPHLTKYQLGADLEIIDRSADWGLLCLGGHECVNVLTRELGIAAEPSIGNCLEVETDAGEIFLAGTDMIAAPAILISGPREAVAALRERIPAEEMAIGTDTLFEISRIEAGFPWCGQDLTSEDIAQSAARTEKTISFTKGCYLGQEPIARLDAMGHTNRELRGLLIPDSSVQVGDHVFAGEKDVGKLSSAAFSPARKATVALAMIRTAHAAPGTELKVRTNDGERPAVVYWPNL